ncbi:hypothetical protein [Pseudomonas sp. GM78]|uniref:hypothetical protein n=1 Tax=Pseudomonas sp. GM78 TaxID=1144337 RepID=UPI00051930C0|nr:hypothetical protein [Pseudomonas sp. GM78]
MSSNFEVDMKISTATGSVNVTVEKSGLKTELTAQRIILDNNFTLGAHFGPNDGTRVPALNLESFRRLEVGSYEIGSEGEHVQAIYGTGRGSVISGDLGYGLLKINKIDNQSGVQYVEGSFEFMSTNDNNEISKIVCKKFWARR